MTSPDPANISSIKIFPPIGVVRVGDSGFDLDALKPDLDSLEYFLPSEIPGINDVPNENNFKFREDKGKRDDRVKHQVREKLDSIQNAPEEDLDEEERNYRKQLEDGTMTLEQVETELTQSLDNHHDRIKRQAVRFRAYAYNKDGENIGEITASRGYKLTWTVHVANHKASYVLFRGMYREQTDKLRNPNVQGNLKPEDRDRLIVDPGPKTISSPDINAKVDISGKFFGSQQNAVDVYLGQLRTNEEGHLIFIGGAGYAQCVANPKVPQPDIVNEFDSVDWIDDVCDGWVKVVVDHDNFRATVESSSKATVMTSPPKFSWGVRSPTTLYDLIADIYTKHSDKQWFDDKSKEVEFDRDIWPVLRATYALSWTNKDAFDGHGVSGKGNYLASEEKLKSKGPDNNVYRQHIFDRLRAPDYKDLSQATTRYMPRLSGNDGDAIEPGINFPSITLIPPIKRYAALTALQYERFALWKDGKFELKDLPWKNATTLDQVELRYRPACLTLAALDHTMGEPLYPGIEMHWTAREPRLYALGADDDKGLIDPPFRINHETMAPGHITRGLSLPWQADYDLCSEHWWPSVKPDDVINERVFGSTTEISEKDFIDDILPQRQKWSRGIRITSIGDQPEYYPGSTDMIRYWSRLGFVVPHKTIKIKRADNKKDPTWLETEREKIVRKDKKTELPVHVSI